MSVYKRKIPGKWESPYFSYKFKYNKKEYRGTCYKIGDENQKCTVKNDALAWETKIKHEVRGLSGFNSVKALIEERRDELAEGSLLPIKNAWKKFCTNAGERFKAMLKGRWDNFTSFMEDNFPEITYMNQVNEDHAKEFISRIRNKGPWIPQKEILIAKQLNVPYKTLSKYLLDLKFPKGEKVENMAEWIEEKSKGIKKKHLRRRKGYSEPKPLKLSPASQNNYLKTCRSIFNQLADSAKIVKNPFGKIDLAKNQPVNREAFTPKELKLIGEKAQGEWFYPLFIVGIYTGMREGDICTLKWKEIDFSTGFIERSMKKTGHKIEVPILPPLKDFFQGVTNKQEYCFPELAERYLNKRTTIGKTVSQFLKGIGIQTQKKIDSRTRAASIKDIHSLRHTFVYLAAKHGVPFAIVQDIVGHISPEMTKQYMRHAGRKDKKLAMQTIPTYIGSGKLTPKDQLVQHLETATDQEIQACLKIFEKKEGPSEK